MAQEEKTNLFGSKNCDFVKFTNYKVRYISQEPKSEPALANLTFRIQPGSLLGVMGPVGSGKSTLVSALLEDVVHLSGTKVQLTDSF